MSTGQAIEAVTLTVRNLLSTVTNNVTVRPPDRAREGQDNGAQLNVFLYEVAHNPALRNFEPPTQAQGGSGLQAPLALGLRYLVTAYSDDPNRAADHDLLGRAMQQLHEHPVLSRTRLEGVLGAANVHLQLERVRFTPIQLSSEEVSKLWTSFQTNYRLSVAYEASVVLIDNPTGVAPLPVLKRGRDPLDEHGDDEGPRVAVGGPPTITNAFVEAWRGRPGVPARTGDRIVVEGQDLGGDVVEVLLHHDRLVDPVVVAAEPASTADRVLVTLPAVVPAGLVRISVLSRSAQDPALRSNTIGFAVATRISAITATPDAGGSSSIDIVVNCDRVVADQSAQLVVGSRQVPAQQPVTAGGQLTFVVDGFDPPSRPYTVRLRVDGVDSIPLVDPDPDPAVALPAAFDAAQQVNLP